MPTHPNHFHRVLIVDDEYLEGELMLAFLERVGHFQATQATSLKELWAYLATGTYDVILMDYRLPDGTGLDALAELPVRGYYLPVIMLTGQGDERIATLSIQKGARDYLVKGNDIFTSLPTRIEKAIHDYETQQTAKKSLAQIRYQALLLNNVRDAVVVWNMDGRITFWNPAAERLFGCRAEEILNCPVETCYLNLFNPVIRVPEPEKTSGQQIERDFHNALGETVWVSSQVSALRDFTHHGQIIGYMDVCRDITKSKNLEAKLVQSAWMASFGELASGVAHQINNPLTTIIAEAQMLLRDLPTGHEYRDYVEAIEQAGWRTQRIVQKLIEFSEPSTDTLETVEINQTIENALHLVSESIRAAGFPVETDLALKLPTVNGNSHRLEVLWVNLLFHLRSAIKAPQKGSLQIRSTVNPHGNIVVEIQNLYHRISSENLPNYFEPQLSKPTFGWETGIELSICREIVYRHNGQITVESDPQHGTILRVILPPGVEK
ncbi:MAG: response regulator [Anaerolineales bacterium]|nr:response regulator [Anaerolineales bacterium]